MKIRLFFAIPVAFMVGLGAFAFSIHSAPDPAATEPKKIYPGIQAHRCNDRGEIDALVVYVDKPGVYTFRWDNIAVCGERV